MLLEGYQFEIVKQILGTNHYMSYFLKEIRVINFKSLVIFSDHTS